MTFSAQDLRQLSDSGISKEKVLAQIEFFKTGFPFITLVRPCTMGDGLLTIDPQQFDSLIVLFNQAASRGRVMKFVPASGAATRMFHSLTTVCNQYEQFREFLISETTDDPDVNACLDFIQNIDKFAFHEDIRNLKQLVNEKRYDEIMRLTLTESGPNYSALPKALIKFHRYPDHSRTALEEHLVEALSYARDAQQTARIHFTISSEHRDLCNALIQSVLPRYEKTNGKLEITFSEQKKSTDTIAVDMQDKPVRSEDGNLYFRPAGHGALLENLNDLNGDIVFIKNIDNVVPDRLKETTYLYKKLLGGYLIQLQNQVFHYLQKISEDNLSETEINDAFIFSKKKLSIAFPTNFDKLPAIKQTEILFDKLDRPIRICGMVKNQGEPGGGPFWIREKNGAVSLQIVEKTQIDVKSDEQKRIMESSTHFNPVDLVCGVRDYKGENFDLRQFADPETGFISIKSKDGKPIKAMELPGLWNGAMAYWNTIFVEVPLITFNPVKTVNDLLRPEHQQKP
ncbi:DUF4301 family protein [bacterium]|nr:MAG: DUF4301 family protein [bacterium]